jgi:hypothetical protein
MLFHFKPSKMRNNIKVFTGLIYFIGSMLYFFIVSVPVAVLVYLAVLIIYLINQIKSICQKITTR